MNIFEQLLTEERTSNLIKLREQINNKWLNKKIENHLKKHSYINKSIEEIKQLILSDDFTASFFVKEPIKQNIIENFIANHIMNISFVSNFNNLYSSVKLFVVDGIIIEERKDGIKSIDYSWNIGNKTFYASQKYTSESGGAQDNQFNDIINFLSNASLNKDENIYFVAIVDGNYYNERKINILKKYCNKKTLIANYFNIEKVLSQYE